MHPPELIPLTDYAPPAMPTEHALRAAWHRLQRRIGMGGDEEPMLARAGLERTSLQLLDDIADPPGCAPMLQALDTHFGDWSRSRDAAPRVQLIVVPPCDTTATLETWARSQRIALLAAPHRADLVGTAAEPGEEDLAGDGLLVVPRLERWFVRQRNGLQAVRSLLARVAGGGRRCLVGCDAWAWAYLVRAVDADLMLPRPQAIAPFDAPRLRQWFAALAADGGDAATFRLARSGEDVLACDDDGAPRSDWLRQLASRSGGIPWVAWHLWRAGLRVRAGDGALSESAARAVADDRRTIWVVDVDDSELPPSHEGRSLLALQALLVHGSLSAAELDAVLPTTGDGDVLPALVASGHLRCDRGDYTLRPTAYPAVRQALQAADYPMGAI